MIRDAAPTLRPRSIRRSLAFGIVGVMLVVVGTGCNRSSRPQPGGATTRQAQNARKQAETYAADAVKGAVAAQVTAHPELAKKTPKDKVLTWAREHLGVNWGTATVSTTVPPAPAPDPTPAPPAPTPAPKPAPTPAPKPAPPPAPPVAPRAEAPIRAAARAASPVVIRERVASDIPYPTEGEAEEATLKQAGERIAQKLRELDPPVEYRPSAAVVKNEYARRDTRLVRPPNDYEKAAIMQAGYHPDRVYVEYTVELSADQVRELRTRDRVGYALRLLGVVTAVALAGFLFLRLDEWSKGYLTSWLAVVAVALAGGVVAALVFV